MQLPILDVAIGVVFLFVTLSMIVSAGVEAIAWFTNRRSKHLLRSLNRLLDNSDEKNTAGAVTNAVLSMPSIGARPAETVDDEDCPPSIDPAAFSHALVEWLAQQRNAPIRTLAELESAIVEHAPERLKATLLCSLRRTQEGLASAVDDLARWFDTTMRQASAWYRQSLQKITLLIALGVTLAMNADVLELSQRLWTSPALRASVTQAAERLVVDGTEGGSGEQGSSGDDFADRVRDIEEALARTDPLPIGWETVPGDPAAWTRKILGLLVTWAGLVLGAPFWFDVLKRLVGLGRSRGATTGKPPTDRSDD